VLVGVFLQIAWNEIDKGLSHLFYALDPLVMGVLLTNILQWCYQKAKATRSGTHWQVFGPVYYVALANVLCMLSPLAILFVYVGKVGYPGSKMWKDGSWFPNTVIGVIIYFAKWVGTGFLMVGVVQLTRLHIKIAKRWRELRGVKMVHADKEECYNADCSKEGANKDQDRVIEQPPVLLSAPCTSTKAKASELPPEPKKTSC